VFSLFPDNAMHSHSHRPVLLLLTSLCATLPAQTWNHVSLGEIREVFTWQGQDPTQQKIWMAEDGGRVRFGDRQNGTTTWVQQSTPKTVRGPLLDIFFLDGGLRGVACGTDGRVIATINGGTTWVELPQVQINSTPALLWGTYFFDSSFGVLAGDKVLHFTTNAGQSWSPVSVVPQGGGHYQFVLYYSFDFIKNGDGTPRHGVVTAKPAAILYTQNATQWTHATILDVNGMPATFPSDYELWDVQFEPNPANPDAAVGYCAGGGNPTRLFRTTDSGRTWREESSTGSPTNIPYGVAVWSANGALACGYGGMILLRTAAGWAPFAPAGGAAPCNLAGNFTAPLIGVDATPTGEVWVGGSFGYVRRGNFSVAAPTLTQDTVQNAAMWRLTSTAFRNDQDGYVGSQAGIGKTSNGGVTWSNDHCTINKTWILDVALDGGTGGVAVGTANGSNLAAYFLRADGTWGDSNVSGLDLHAVAWVRGTTFVTVGSSGTALRSLDGGATFTSAGTPDDPNLPGLPTLNDIAVVSTSVAFVVGSENGQAVAYVTSNLNVAAPGVPTWSPVPVAGGISALHAAAARVTGTLTEVFAVGAAGAVVAWNGSSFATVPGAHLATSNRLLAAALPTGSTQVFLGGDYGTVLRFDGTQWSNAPSRTSKDVRGFWFRDGSFGFAACASGIDTSDTAKGSVASSCFIGWR
jgi:photosystem II stability/assembly factor-like uncharacterized protein